jgi:hypothetical protein
MNIGKWHDITIGILLADVILALGDCHIWQQDFILEP